MDKDNHSPKDNRENMMNRKGAIQKAGKYAAFTAASMVLLLSPVTSSASQNSPTPPHRPKRH